jgi:DNA-binding transcriptional ArsR family regulator
VPPDVFFAIADPTRRRLLDALGRQPAQAVNSLAAPFSMTRPAISQHLRILRDAGLVVEHRVGRERRYQLQATPLREVSDWVGQYEQFWQSHLTKLGNFLDQQAAQEAQP